MSIDRQSGIVLEYRPTNTTCSRAKGVCYNTMVANETLKLS